MLGRIREGLGNWNDRRIERIDDRFNTRMTGLLGDEWESLPEEKRQQMARGNYDAVRQDALTFGGTNSAQEFRNMAAQRAMGYHERSANQQRQEEWAGFVQNNPSLNDDQRFLLMQLGPEQGAELLTNSTTVSANQATVNPFTGQQTFSLPGADLQDHQFMLGAYEDTPTSFYDHLGAQEAAAREPQAQSRTLYGKDISPMLPANMVYEQAPDGRLSLVPGQDTSDPTDYTSNWLTAHNNYVSQSRERSDQLRAGEVVRNSLARAASGEMSDFDVTQSMLNWLTALGANPRVGSDGELVAESGLWNEAVRQVNRMRGGGGVTPEQARQLQTAVDSALEPVIRNQLRADQTLGSQMGAMDYPGDVSDITGSMWDPSAFRGLIDTYGLEGR